MLFDGYEGDPERTAQVLRDGWFRTYDLGRVDADGRLRVTGRVDDMIISGGVKVPARPSPRGSARTRVRRAWRCVGVPDERVG